LNAGSSTIARLRSISISRYMQCCTAHTARHIQACCTWRMQLLWCMIVPQRSRLRVGTTRCLSPAALQSQPLVHPKEGYRCHTCCACGFCRLSGRHSFPVHHGRPTIAVRTHL
jgi:hypothetical protein